MPHTPEWETKRLAAVREAAKIRVYPKGYHRKPHETSPMLRGLEAARKRDPDKFKRIAIANLPKNASGSNNGNWKGGKTKESRDFRTQQSRKFSKWRKAVLQRDGNRCKECGSAKSLEAHHIISLAESKITAFLVMNGVTLCRECHKKTDNYCSRACKIVKEWGSLTGHILCICRTIPHRWQAYETVGNWAWTESGALVVFVSDMGNESYEILVSLHEQIEAWLCLKRGISQEAVDEFDKAYEANRESWNLDEPGNSPEAPYHREHVFATLVEQLVAHELGVDWADYDNAVMGLSQHDLQPDRPASAGPDEPNER